jgi:hypothetical protein
VLVELGIVTIESSQSAYGKGPSIGKALNKVTGKDSTSAYAFKEANWGEVTRQHFELELEFLKWKRSSWF